MTCGAGQRDQVDWVSQIGGQLLALLHPGQGYHRPIVIGQDVGAWYSGVLRPDVHGNGTVMYSHARGPKKTMSVAKSSSGSRST